MHVVVLRQAGQHPLAHGPHPAHLLAQVPERATGPQGGLALRGGNQIQARVGSPLAGPAHQAVADERDRINSDSTLTPQQRQQELSYLEQQQKAALARNDLPDRGLGPTPGIPVAPADEVGFRLTYPGKGTPIHSREQGFLEMLMSKIAGSAPAIAAKPLPTGGITAEELAKQQGRGGY